MPYNTFPVIVIRNSSNVISTWFKSTHSSVLGSLWIGHVQKRRFFVQWVVWLENRFSSFRQRTVQTGFTNRFKRFPKKRSDSSERFVHESDVATPSEKLTAAGSPVSATRRTDTAENKTLPLQWAPPSPFPHRLSVHINKATPTSALSPFPRSTAERSGLFSSRTETSVA